MEDVAEARATGATTEWRLTKAMLPGKERGQANGTALRHGFLPPPPPMIMPPEVTGLLPQTGLMGPVVAGGPQRPRSLGRVP